MDTVLLAVKQTAEVIQEAEGGIRYLTEADFGGGGGGGDASLAEQQTQTAHLAAIETNTANLSGGSSNCVLNLTFDLLANCPVSPATSASEWNIYFSTNVITSASVTGNVVSLVCSGGFKLPNDTFKNFTHLVEFYDKNGIIYDLGNNCFQYCESLKHIVLNGIADTKDNFCNTCQVLETATLGKVSRISDGSFAYMQSGVFSLNAPIKNIGNCSFIGISTPVLNFLELEHCDEFLSAIATQVWKVNVPKLKTAYRLCYNSGAGLELNASSLEVVVDMLLYNPKSGFIWHLESLKSVGASSFSGASGISGTVYTNKAFFNSEIFQTFLANNPSVVVELVDLDQVEKTFTNPTLTLGSAAGQWVAMEGYNTVELVLTMGTLATPPTIALDLSYDGVDYLRTATIVGEANLAKAISAISGNAKYMRYYVVTGGSSIGAGASIKLFATKS